MGAIPAIPDADSAIREAENSTNSTNSIDSGNKIINLHGQNYYDLKQLAGDDWQASTPAEQEAFAHLVAIRKLRENGEKPAYYTQISTCNQCGPVWLWKGAPTAVQACVWCFNRVQGVHIPRPETIACNTCKHFMPNDHSPGAGVGECGQGQPGRFAREKHNCPTYQFNNEVPNDDVNSKTK